MIQTGKLGDIRRVDIKAHFPQWPRSWQQNHWISTREQGGFIREVVPHFLQLVNRLFGPLGEVVSCVEYPDDPEACETGIIACLQILADRNIQVLLNGLSQAAVQEEASLTIYGTLGRVKLNNWRNLLFGKEGEELAEVPLQQTDHLFELIDHVVNAIQGRDNDIITFYEGVEIQKTLESLLTAATYR
ncbi:Gfo/Idh/MocA family oxidoreductase [Brevibacillus sp. GCM10020057]|uniref:Gfo/Idh/MocA family oxidoreductase n=1 Tax=Brevibacillus sp. GCM10020057 TaxID=3317327 RepID=UPI003630E130